VWRSLPKSSSVKSGRGPHPLPRRCHLLELNRLPKHVPTHPPATRRTHALSTGHPLDLALVHEKHRRSHDGCIDLDHRAHRRDGHNTVQPRPRYLNPSILRVLILRFLLLLLDLIDQSAHPMRDVNAKFVPILQEVLRCRRPSDARRGAVSSHRIVTSKKMTSRKKEKEKTMLCRIL
jgi:hypothetical protein